MKILEICCFNLPSVLVAQEMGAQRIELCADAAGGGTTPSAGLIQEARRKLTIPLYTIIRPREGDFLYSAEEYEAMTRDVLRCRNLGCDGIVTGILLPDGRVDKQRCSRLVELAYPMGVTFHRAFDMSRDAFESLEAVISAGCERILTSGQMPDAPRGEQLIAELVLRADHRISIMPGAGIRAANISQLADRTGADEFHSSARTRKTSAMEYIRTEMGEDPSFVIPDAEEIRQMRACLDGLP